MSKGSPENFLSKSWAELNHYTMFVFLVNKFAGKKLFVEKLRQKHHYNTFELIVKKVRRQSFLSNSWAAQKTLQHVWCCCPEVRRKRSIDKLSRNKISTICLNLSSKSSPAIVSVEKFSRKSSVRHVWTSRRKVRRKTFCRNVETNKSLLCVWNSRQKARRKNFLSKSCAESSHYFEFEPPVNFSVLVQTMLTGSQSWTASLFLFCLFSCLLSPLPLFLFLPLLLFSIPFFLFPCLFSLFSSLLFCVVFVEGFAARGAEVGGGSPTQYSCAAYFALCMALALAMQEALRTLRRQWPDFWSCHEALRSPSLCLLCVCVCLVLSSCPHHCYFCAWLSACPVQTPRSP